MSYRRDQPSPRYRELQALYRAMHEQGERFLGIPAEHTFPGSSLLRQASRIKRLIVATGARTMLDYGSGKGRQYAPLVIRDPEGGTWSSILEYWGVDEIVCYDPCYAPFSTRPEGTFDGVIATDVLEHCPEDDLPWIVEEVFGYAQRFVYANVACFPARKRLPNGENAHCTIKPVAWWRAVFETSAAMRPDLMWEVRIQSETGGPAGKDVGEERIGTG